MAHEVCNEIKEWIEEQIEQPVERWLDQLQQTCQQQDCNWWCLCCNKWLCWLVWIVVKVVVWIVITVGKWVTHTVCELIADVVGVIVSAVQGLTDILGGIFTGNWPRAWDGLVTLVGGGLQGAIDIARKAFLGDAIAYISDEMDTNSLRQYVRVRLERKYQGEELRAIKDALGVDYGTFGFRIRARAIRTFVSSDAQVAGADAPELIRWHENPALRLNIKELCGFEYAEFWRRFRPEVVGESGSISEGDIDNYISSRGASGLKFSIFCMDTATLDTKIDTASDKARALGLLYRWRKETEAVVKPEHVRNPGFDQNAGTALENFLSSVFGRRRKAIDAAGATADLCNIPGVGVFRYTDNLTGLTANLATSQCGLDGSQVSGLTFMDRLPDIVFKYVLGHEMGHYFGLCHVDGANHMMYTAAPDQNKSAWDWGLLPEYLYLHGGPIFVLEEAKQVWDYIIDNFTSECLRTRAQD